MKVAIRVAIAAAWLLSVGCADPPSPRTSGDSCESSTECESSLCYQSQCLDPAADDDGDGLINQIEAQLGTNAVLMDTDGDGLSDYAEVQGNLETPPDEDGDGLIDAVESALVSSLLLGFSETDDDCLAPQKDPEDGVQNQDEAWVADLACCCYGACSKVAVEPLAYACVDDAPVCTFSPTDDLDGDGLLAACDEDDDGDQVPDADDCDPEDATLSTPVEELCDGEDNDCDGLVDEGWPNLGDPCLTPETGCGEIAYFECNETGADVTCPGESAQEGTPCDDGNPDTLSDVCDVAGNCQGTPCTTDSTCHSTKIEEGACVLTLDAGVCFIDGACRQPGDTQSEPNQPCLVCNPEANQEAWSQLLGKCLIDGVCYADGDGHPEFACKHCDASSAPSSWTYRAASTPCDDEDACTTGDSCTPDAVCLGYPIACVDPYDCTVDICDPVSGCVHVEDDALCDDGVACTSNTCSGAEGCLFTPDDGLCDDGDVCTTNTCDPIADCQEAWAPGDGCIYDCAVTHVSVGQTEGFQGGTGHVAFVGELAYIVQQPNDENLSLVDWSDPEQPVEVALLSESSEEPSLGGIGLANANIPRRVIHHAPDRLYISSSTGVTMLDVSTPTEPVVLGHAAGLNSVYGMAMHPTESLLYAATTSSGVVVVDVADPEAPTLSIAHAIEGGPKTHGVAVGHNTLYLVGFDLSLYTYDTSVPSLPALLGQLEGIADPGSFAETQVIVEGDTALLISNRDGYRLVNVADPAKPIELSYSASPDDIFGAVFFEGYVLLGSKPGLQVLDIADPTAPVTVMDVESFPDMYGVGMVGHRVLVSTTAHLLQIFDLTLPCTDDDPCSLDTCHVLEACDFPLEVSCDDLDPCTADSCNPGEGCAHQDIEGCDPGAFGGAGVP